MNTKCRLPPPPGPDQVIPTDRLKTWEPNGTTKLKIGDQGVSAHTPVSVPTLLKKAAEKYVAFVSRRLICPLLSV